LGALPLINQAHQYKNKQTNNKKNILSILKTFNDFGFASSAIIIKNAL
jgi:hypothetical protein